MGLKAVGSTPAAASNGNAAAVWGSITGNQADQTDLAANFTSLNSSIANRVVTTTGVIAGAGLSGGGALSGNVSLTVTYGSAANTAAQGNDARLSDARTPLAHNSNHASSGNDPVNHDTLANYVANQHIDHALTYIAAGTGLTGGGNIAANRTFNLANTAVGAGNYGDSGNVPVLTVDAQGRITAANKAAIAGGSGITQLTGDVTAGPGSGSQVATLANTGVGAGNYGDAGNIPILTLDLKGRVTAANKVAVSGGITQLTGDGTAGPGSGSQALTLANSGVTATTYGDATNVPQLTVDAKGRVTAVSNVAITSSGGGPSVAHLTANLISNTNASLTALPGLTFSLLSGVYYSFQYTILFRSPATTTGIGLTVTVPAFTSFGATARIPNAADGVSGSFQGWITASNDVVQGTAVQAANTDYVAEIYGTILPSANGNITPAFHTEITASNVTVRQGSLGQLLVS